MAATVSSLSADIIGVEEADSHVIRSLFRNQMKMLGRHTGLQWNYAAARSHFAVTGSDGIGLLTRGQILDHDTVELQPHATGHQRRVALFAKVELPSGERVSVAVTHLDTQPEVAVEQLRSLLATFSSNPRWSGPQILLGDLNLKTSTVEQVTRTAGYDLAGGVYSAPTREPAHRIDHIATRHLRINAVNVPVVRVSDHRPVIAELE